uniref:Uncharacterized protein n=1 Tax=Anguilla anguilla TaxID=7936 RepID=A0A0E9VNV0_ANGAN
MNRFTHTASIGIPLKVVLHPKVRLPHSPAYFQSVHFT